MSNSERELLIDKRFSVRPSPPHHHSRSSWPRAIIYNTSQPRFSGFWFENYSGCICVNYQEVDIVLQALLSEAEGPASYQPLILERFYSCTDPPTMQNQLVLHKNQDFNPTCCFLFFPPPFQQHLSLPHQSIKSLTLPILISKLNLIYYASCLLSLKNLSIHLKRARMTS